ncbi:hypothetical protein [Streptomyces himastatinicus]|uniref:hypothetical protein n=1 Tax=Streptomyces himastatinicus TaxID=998084 RepID=UPI0001B512CF|nr:hypothetical protein [Streptomyces himastatinicus]
MSQADTDHVETPARSAEPDAPDQPKKEGRGLWARLRGAVPPRIAAMLVGALLLQLGFVLSYVGAFHHPQPHRIPIAVAAPERMAPDAVEKLNGIPGHPLKATATDEATARERLRTGEISGVLIVKPGSRTDTLLTAGAGGASTASALETVIEKAEKTQKRTASVVDAFPAQAGDARGLSSFYLVVGWTVGGYLLAALLGVSLGARPATARGAGRRLLAAVPYAVLSGLGGAAIVGLFVLAP